MSCPYQKICGGCRYRDMAEAEYHRLKEENFKKILSGLSQENIPFGPSVFIGDNVRRRASMAFSCRKGKLILGFNQSRSSELVDISACCLLTPRLNANLENIRSLLEELCAVPLASAKAKKGRKTVPQYISGGDVWLCEADNGIDIVLEFCGTPSLEHRMIISEKAQQYPDIIRISHREKVDSVTEPLIEKAKPLVKMGKYDVYIPSGTFLQPSKAGEQALVSLVMKYLDGKEGKIADLFCGVGTFSYPLAENNNNKILAADSSAALLDGFRRSLNKNRISNVEVVNKNLFKYPFDEKELAGYDVIVFDPPRAGAAAQTAQIAAFVNKPKKLIAVSCNPHSFVNDANTLIAAGYHLREVTLVDQFAFSEHSELVACFEL